MSLSDEIIVVEKGFQLKSGGWDKEVFIALRVGKVKKAVKEFVNWICSESYKRKGGHIDSSDTMKKAKEIFGDKLR